MSGEKHHEIYQRRRTRNTVVALGVATLAAVLFAVTIVKLQAAAANPFSAMFNPQIEQMQGKSE